MSLQWWQKNVIYHIYLPSFKDSNDDGVGDLKGIISKMDYFQYLGVSSLMLSPFYPSPMKDNGYDVTSFVDIDPIYGTMDDFEELMLEANKRDMNVIIDFVANHTSDLHPWFLKSINKEDPYTEFYVWADSKSKGTEKETTPPNNWLSVFGGSAWTWNEKRQQFYLHQFLPEQPDLNYHNAILRFEMRKILRFWLEKGVDGFRVDAASHLFEDQRLLDEPRAKTTKAKEDEYEYLDHIYTKGQPDTFPLLGEWRKILDEYSKKCNKSKILVIEGVETPPEMMLYYGGVQQGLAEIPMNFQFYKVMPEWTGIDLKKNIEDWLNVMPMGKYPNYVMSSHDFSRVATRLGSRLASSLLMVEMLLPGIPFCYYGDELGMEDGLVPPELTRDSFALRTVPENSRDPMRTPMQWNAEKNAGFTDSDKPFLPLNENFATVNVEAEKTAPYSSLKNFKSLLQLRKEPSISCGLLEFPLVNERIFSFTRLMIGTKCFLVIVNMSSEDTFVDFTEIWRTPARDILLEVTNTECYEKVRSKYCRLRNFGESASFSALSVENSLDLSALNNIHLEPRQGMVISFYQSID